jgi:ferredoxin
MLSFPWRRFTGKGIDKDVQGKIGQSLVHVPEEHGIHVPNACEGSCAWGICQMYILKGMELLQEITDQENQPANATRFILLLSWYLGKSVHPTNIYS